jgi:hypothetical protein
MTNLPEMLAGSRRVVNRSARQLASRALPALRRGQRPLWVLGGSAGREYCDNSRAVHEHLLEHRPDIRAVWVIDRRADDLAEVRSVGEWVDHDSLAAHRMVASADVLVFSHGIHDLPGLLANRSATIARLGHGLTAFKQTRGRRPRSLQRMTDRVDLAPVASPFERSHKESWGFDPAKLPVTGLARWDLMRRARAAAIESDTVLFALTWRDWIEPGSLLGTDYLSSLSSCADSDWFIDVLGPSGLRAQLFLHPLVREALLPRLSEMGRAPDLVTRGRDVPDALARAALVITDYSSLAWDALYLGIPVIFFHFDLEEYLAHRASFVDLRGRLFGPTARSVAELDSAIRSFVANGLRLPDYEADQERWTRTAFAYQDDRNCERIVVAIEQFTSR